MIAGLQPIADLVRALLAVYAARGVPPDQARRLTLALAPLVIEVADRDATPGAGPRDLAGQGGQDRRGSLFFRNHNNVGIFTV